MKKYSKLAENRAQKKILRQGWIFVTDRQTDRHRTEKILGSGFRHSINSASGATKHIRRSAIDKYSSVALWPVKKSARAQNKMDNGYVDIKFMNENDKRQIWGQIFFTLHDIYLTCFNAINHE